jgi:Putative MetA-pathway of phenol degradation
MSSSRFGLIAVIPFLAAAMSGGCSAVDRPMAKPASEAAQTSPSAVRVRAQSDEPPTEAVAPSSDPAGALPKAPSTDQPGAPASNLATPRVVTGVLDTALESLFGEALTSDWTPLSFATLFSEGWNQPFVFSPASDSGALRQEWINSANGVFYRQWVLDYNFRDRATKSGNRDIGTYSIFAPLSRRLELFVTIPFVDYHVVDNSSASSGGRSSLSPKAASPGASYRSTFGDVVFTPQVLLSETKNTSIMSVLAIRTPTGSLAAGNGDTSIGPQIQFWQGLPNRWVVRGGAGPTIPLSATGLHTTFDTNLTLGRFLTLDDVKYFKELTVWVAASNSAAMDHSGPAADAMTILPGIRFRIAKDTWFLYGVEIPLVAPRNEDYGMYFRLVRRW